MLPDRTPVRIGELVVAIGNPLGLERSVSLGVVSALHRDLPTRDGVLEGLIQTDASVNPGNSGGPLLDAGGAVVGITTAMLPWARGIAFAIPSRTASWVAAVLIRHGEVRRPRIGILARSEELPPEGRAVRVLRVEAGTPADDAGLRGQDLLLSANGSALAGLDDLQRALVLADAPEIRLEVLRGRERRELSHPSRARGLTPGTDQNRTDCSPGCQPRMPGARMLEVRELWHRSGRRVPNRYRPCPGASCAPMTSSTCATARRSRSGSRLTPTAGVDQAARDRREEAGAPAPSGGARPARPGSKVVVGAPGA